jgi:hypothetical protein
VPIAIFESGVFFRAGLWKKVAGADAAPGFGHQLDGRDGNNSATFDWFPAVSDK